MKKEFPKDYYFARGCSQNHPDFSKEELTIDGRLTEASINFGETKAEAIQGLPATFHHYAVTTGIELAQKQGRIIKNSLKDNPNHCLLSNIELKDAKNLFSKVIIR